MYWTSCYSSILGILYLLLSFKVIKIRRSKQVSLGSGSDEQLKQAIRAHGNFIEYVPFALILLFLSEFNGAPEFIIHFAGLALLLGRIIHALSFNFYPPKGKLRVLGMVLTFSSIFFGVIANITILSLGYL